MSHDPYADVVEHLFPRAELEAVVRLTGGVSADVHRLDVKLDDGRTTSVVLRAHGASHSGHSAELEYQLLQTLRGGGVPVPEPMLVDESGGLIAAPYLVMAFVEGSSAVPAAQEGQYVDVMAAALSKIHAFPTADLPTLPVRNDPLPEMFDYLPDGPEWEDLRAHLRTLADTAYVGVAEAVARRLLARESALAERRYRGHSGLGGCRAWGSALGCRLFAAGAALQIR